MNRVGMVAVTATLVLAPVVIAACGDENQAGATLPPIATTTTTTINPVTTTIVRQYYEVKAGDRLGNIADLLGVDMNELMALNGITNPNLIDVGQALLIPPPTILIETLPTG